MKVIKGDFCNGGDLERSMKGNMERQEGDETNRKMEKLIFKQTANGANTQQD